MKFLKLFVLVAVLFFGMAYGQKSSKPKPVKEDVVYKDTDKVDKKLISQKVAIMVFMNYWHQILI